MALAVQLPDFTNSGVVFAPATVGGDTFANTGTEVVMIKVGATPITVTVSSPNACNQGFNHDISLNLPANTQKVLGRLPASRFNDNMGYVKVTCNPVTDVTVAVVRP